METEVKIPARDATLDGNLTVPPAARGIVLFVHGIGSHTGPALEAPGS